MSEEDLLDVTRTAIEAAFVDRKTKAALLARLEQRDCRAAAKLWSGRARPFPPRAECR